MTSRDRLMTVFRGGVPDRAPIKLWGFDPDQKPLHPGYQPVMDAARQYSDWVVGSGSAFDIYCGCHAPKIRETKTVPGPDPEWVFHVTTWHTPQGDLQQTYRGSTVGRPGYDHEHLLKQPEDLEKLLSLPYEPYPFSSEHYLARIKAIGDRGLVMFGLDHPMYALERLIGSENFALWSLEHDALLRRVMAVFAARIRDHVKAFFASDIMQSGLFTNELRPVFAWVGPELCQPPLMSFAAFDRYVLDVDRPLCDLIHQHGGLVWVHSHGRMRHLLSRFVRMGVDVLNPIEPPPMGDITLPEAFVAVEERMGLEGNLETHDLMTVSADRVRELVAEALGAGHGRRHILCATSGYMEAPFPTATMLRNWVVYLEEAWHLVGGQ